MGFKDLFEKLCFKKEALNSNSQFPKDPERAFFVSAFSLLGKLAMADETLDERERQCVERFIDSHLTLSSERKSEAMKLFCSASYDENEAKEYALHIRNVFPHSFQIRETLLDLLMTVSLADEVLDPREEDMLRQIADGFGISQTQFDQIKSRHLSARGRSSEDRFFQILGVSSDCTDEELINSFRKLSSSYEPQRILAGGVPRDFVLIAQKKLEDIEEAFNVISAKRGLNTTIM